MKKQFPRNCLLHTFSFVVASGCALPCGAQTRALPTSTKSLGAQRINQVGTVDMSAALAVIHDRSPLPLWVVAVRDVTLSRVPGNTAQYIANLDHTSYLQIIDAFISRSSPREIASLARTYQTPADIQSLNALRNKSTNEQKAGIKVLLLRWEAQRLLDDTTREPETKLPTQVAGVEAQGRQIGNRNLQSVGLFYGNSSLKTDFSARVMNLTQPPNHALPSGLQGSNTTGYGVLMRHNLTQYDLTVRDLQTRIATIQATDVALENEAAFKQALRSKFDDLLAKLSEVALQAHAAVLAGYNQFGGTTLQVYDLGLAFSWLRPLGCGGRGSGLLFQANLLYTWSDLRLPDAPFRSRSFGPRFSLGIAIQENIPSVYSLRGGKNLRRWHWQYGFEYSFANRIISSDSYTVYGRWRDRGSGEYTLFAGRAPDANLMVGVSVSSFLKW